METIKNILSGKVKTGYETTIMVTPRVLHTTDSAQAMAYRDRQCRTKQEAATAGLRIFKQETVTLILYIDCGI